MTEQIIPFRPSPVVKVLPAPVDKQAQADHDYGDIAIAIQCAVDNDRTHQAISISNNESRCDRPGVDEKALRYQPDHSQTSEHV
jgi:hypothetical protein